MDFWRKIQQFFMNDFLHSKFPKMRWICGMSRAENYSSSMSKTSERKLSMENTSRFWFKRVGNFLISEKINIHFLVIFRYLQISFAVKYFGVDQVGFFLGGGAGHLQKWAISSDVRVQITQELVRLITLIGLNKLLIHIILPKSLKKFSRTAFRWTILRKCTIVVFWRLL